MPWENDVSGAWVEGVQKVGGYWGARENARGEGKEHLRMPQSHP